MAMFNVTATTDANGFFDFLADNSIVTGVVASAASPQSGALSGLVSCTADQTGDKKVTVRVWHTDANWSVKPVASQQVTVNLWIV